MISSGISQAMSRIAAIQSIAGQTSGGFAGALGAAMAGPAAEQVATRATVVPPVTSLPTAQAVGPPSVSGPAAASGHQPGSAPTLPAGAAQWQSAIGRAARDAGVDPKLLTAVVWSESNFKPDAVSHAGAIGLAQLMPGTAEGLGVDPYDPDQNLAGGARFLKGMIDQFGRVDLALAAYNAGPARVASLHDGGPGVPVSEGYVTTVLDRYRTLGGTP